MANEEFHRLERRFHLKTNSSGSAIGPFQVRGSSSRAEGYESPDPSLRRERPAASTDSLDQRRSSDSPNADAFELEHSLESGSRPPDNRLLVEDKVRAFSVLYQNQDYELAATLARDVLMTSPLEVGTLKAFLGFFEETEDLTGQEETLLRGLGQIDLEELQRFEWLKKLGNVQLRLQDFDGAEENYFKAYRINPSSDALLVNMGTLEFRKQNYEQARERFVQALTASPQNDKAWVGLGLVHSIYGDFVLSLANLERALDLNPENRTGIQLYSEMAFKHGSLQKLFERLESYLHSHQQDIEILILQSKVALVLGRYPIVLQCAENVLSIEPEHGEAVQLKEAARAHMAQRHG